MKNINFIRVNKNLIKSKDISFQKNVFLNNILKKYYFDQYYLGYLNLIHRLNPVMEQFEDLNYNIKCELQLINKDTNNILIMGNKLGSILKNIENSNEFNKKIVGEGLITNKFSEINLKHVENKIENYDGKIKYINVRENKGQSIVIINSVNKLLNSIELNKNVSNTELKFLFNSTDIVNTSERENVDNKTFNNIQLKQSIENLKHVKIDKLSLNSVSNLNSKKEYLNKYDLISRKTNKSCWDNIENVILNKSNLKSEEVYKLGNKEFIKNLIYKKENKIENYTEEIKPNNVKEDKNQSILVINSISKLFNSIKSNKNMNNTELRFLLNSTEVESTVKENILEKNINNNILKNKIFNNVLLSNINLKQNIENVKYGKVDKLSLNNLNSLNLKKEFNNKFEVLHKLENRNIIKNLICKAGEANNYILKKEYLNKYDLISRKINKSYWRNIENIILNIRNLRSEEVYKLENKEFIKNLIYKKENKIENYTEEIKPNNVKEDKNQSILVIKSINKLFNSIKSNKNMNNTELRFLLNSTEVESTVKENILEKNINSNTLKNKMFNNFLLNNINLKQNIENVKYEKLDKLSLNNLNLKKEFNNKFEILYKLENRNFIKNLIYETDNYTLKKEVLNKYDLISRKTNKSYWSNIENVILNKRNLKSKEVYKLGNKEFIKNLIYKKENNVENYTEEIKNNNVKENREQRTVVINSINKLFNYIKLNRNINSTELKFFLNSIDVENTTTENILRKNINSNILKNEIFKNILLDNTNFRQNIENVKYEKVDKLSLNNLNSLNFKKEFNDKFEVLHKLENRNIENIILNTRNLRSEEVYKLENKKFIKNLIYKKENKIENYTEEIKPNNVKENKDQSIVVIKSINKLFNSIKSNKNMNNTELRFLLNSTEVESTVKENILEKNINSNTLKNKMFNNFLLNNINLKQNIENVKYEKLDKLSLNNLNLKKEFNNKFEVLHKLENRNFIKNLIYETDNYTLKKEVLNKYDLISRKTNKSYWNNIENVILNKSNLKSKEVYKLGNKEFIKNLIYKKENKVENYTEEIKNNNVKENREQRTVVINSINKLLNSIKSNKNMSNTELRFLLNSTEVENTVKESILEKNINSNMLENEIFNNILLNNINLKQNIANVKYKKVDKLSLNNLNSLNLKKEFNNKFEVLNKLENRNFIKNLVYKADNYILKKEYLNKYDLISRKTNKSYWRNIGNVILNTRNLRSEEVYKLENKEFIKNLIYKKENKIENYTEEIKPNNVKENKDQSIVVIKSINKLLSFIELKKNTNNTELKFLINSTEVENRVKENILEKNINNKILNDEILNNILINKTNLKRNTTNMKYVKVDKLNLNNLSKLNLNNLNLKKEVLNRYDLIGRETNKNYVKKNKANNIVMIKSVNKLLDSTESNKNTNNTELNFLFNSTGNKDSFLNHKSYDYNNYNELNDLVFKVNHSEDLEKVNEMMKNIENENIKLKKLVTEEISEIKLKNSNEINIKSISERVYKNIENKLKFEKQRRGMV